MIRPDGVAKLEYVLRREQLRKPTVSKLNKALTLPEDTNLPWPKVEPFEAAELEYDRLVSMLRQKNPELAGLSSEAMAARSRIELAKKNFYPDIGVGIEWTEFEEAVMSDDSVAVVRRICLMAALRVSVRPGQNMSIEQEKTDGNTLLANAQSYYDYNDSIKGSG
jgi:hypothetical protein